MQIIIQLLVLLKACDISAYCPVLKGKFYKELFVSSRSRNEMLLELRTRNLG